MMYEMNFNKCMQLLLVEIFVIFVVVLVHVLITVIIIACIVLIPSKINNVVYCERYSRDHT